jgi:hypothetical protein
MKLPKNDWPKNDWHKLLRNKLKLAFIWLFRLAQKVQINKT